MGIAKSMHKKHTATLLLGKISEKKYISMHLGPVLQWATIRRSCFIHPLIFIVLENVKVNPRCHVISPLNTCSSLIALPCPLSFPSSSDL